MKRLIPGLALVGLLLTFLPTPTAAAGDNTATTLFPVDEATQLETHSFVNCHVAATATSSQGRTCARPTGRRVSRPGCGHGKPPRSGRITGWRTWTRTPPANSSGCIKRVEPTTITTVYFGEGPPDKYQTTGVINSVSWATGQPMSANTLVYVCTHMQVVYPGVNLTSPSTCAQTPIT